MNPEKEKENLRKRIWELNNSIRHAKTGDEIEALISVRTEAEDWLWFLVRMESQDPGCDTDPNGAFCDSNIMI
jgi:hypothetical protein